ncbi:TRAP transporter large permease [Rhizobium sp. RU36D]|uniref:TRAP transporter large permease n=1 Tax=Rhizobium sp. RU36D TaxID=1907415 RepID=UPI0009D87683|nr:TRAP transporter large permease [Rhizobium sp. RU36D]SMC98760.1 TRAP transporter, DctM subunit [Rhizobium sp. RU36D]
MSFEFTLCLVTLFVAAAIGMPIAFAMIVSAIVYLFASGQDLALAAEQLIQSVYDSFVLLAVPLFIVAANIMNVGEISDRLLAFCKALVGRFKGGMAQVDILVSLIFSGMSGSAVADAAGVGKITIRMMLKTGHYTPGFAGAVVAASATIGPIIPPSIPLVLYALVSDASIGYLFLGGVVPGLLMTAVLMIMNSVIANRRHIPAEEAVPLRELPRITFRALPALMMPVILLAGIYGGATTPTEAAAVAAFYALLVSGLLYRSLSLRSLYNVFLDSSRSSASVGLVIGSALIFNYIVAAENIPAALSNLLATLELSRWQFLIFVNVLFLLLGCVLDATTIILVIIPLFLPTVKALGIDPIHFGVVAVVNCMIGLITPPYGMLLFVINGTTGIAIKDIVREGFPFLIALLIALALLTAFPELVLALPRLLGYEG